MQSILSRVRIFMSVLRRLFPPECSKAILGWEGMLMSDLMKFFQW